MVRKIPFSVVLAAAVLASWAMGQESPAPRRVEVKLRNTRWQTLPVEVKDVWAGSDGRPWYELRTTDDKVTSAEVRSDIEKAFGQEAPTFHGATPALFEPGGRVWFHLHVDESDQCLLAGYDGKTWIQNVAKGKAQAVIGSCPGHDTASAQYHTNAWQDGCAFFVAMGGVHVYDGTHWTFLDFKLKELDRYYPGLVPLPDGKTLVAYMPAAAYMPDNHSQVHVCRSGKWTEAPLPPAVRNGQCQGIAPADEGGVWLFWYDGGVTNTGVMDYWALGTGTPADFASALKRLGDADFKVRAAATEELSKGDRRTMALAEKAAGEAKDPEVRDRLRQIATTIAGRPPEPQRLGDIRVSGVSLCRCDALGTAYIFAQAATDAAARHEGPALVIARPGHQPVALWDADYVDAWRRGFELSGARPVGDGRLIWLPSTDAADSARLIDTEEGGRTVLESPDPRFGTLGPALPDGTVFMTGGLVGVCRPNAPDERLVLKADARDVNKASVAPDGVIWADVPEKGLHVFDGKEWRPIKGPGQPEWAHWVAAGQGGTALARTFSGAVFVKKEEAHVGANLRAVIQDHAADVAAAFSASGAAVYGGVEGTGIVADKAGRIWLLEGQRLGVFVKDRWLEPAAADGIDVAKIKRLAAVGDGSRIYLTYDERDETGRNSFFGEVKDGRLVFSPAPYCTLIVLPLDVRDPAGGLWVHAWVPDGLAVPGGECVQRVTEAGAVQTLRPAGSTILYDKGGNLWLLAPWTTQAWDPLRVEVWRDGRMEHAMRLGLSGSNSLASDKPGSVWAWTNSGLCHLTADDPAAPAKFTVRQTYTVEGVRGRLDRLAVGPPGFLAAFTSHDTADSSRGGQAWHVSLIPMPKDDK